MKLQCVCGKVLAVPDSMTGERIRCKECGKVMTIRPSTEDAAPARPSDPGDHLAVKDHRRCARCGRSWPVTSNICTACGINMDSGAALYVSLDASDEVTRKKARPGLVGRLLRFIGMKGH